MKKRLLIDCSNQWTRIALIEDDRLVELVAEPDGQSSQVGNIYVGIVKNILPCEFAFVDIGSHKNAFLHLSDAKEKRLLEASPLKRGQSLLVQVLKDETGSKGAYVTTNIALTGRYCVVQRAFDYQDISVSRKIGDEEERERLKKMMREVLPQEYTGILRTQSVGHTREEIETEIASLVTAFQSLEAKWAFVRPPSLVYGSQSAVVRGFKELMDGHVMDIVINNLEQANAMEKELSVLGWEHPVKIQVEEDEQPLFSRYGIEGQISRALEKKVTFGSGGFLVIEQTEACVVIDVNTGGYIGKQGHEASVLEINKQAAVEIARQIRLRNLSGIIIVDFVDMKLEASRNHLRDLFKKELLKDRIPATMAEESVLGLCCLTRKKTREPLWAILQHACDHCNGTGKKRKKMMESNSHDERK